MIWIPKIISYSSSYSERSDFFEDEDEDEDEYDEVYAPLWQMCFSSEPLPD